MANLDHLFTETEKKDPAVATAEPAEKLDYLFSEENEFTSDLDYLFDTNLNYATRKPSARDMMLQDGEMSVFSEDERKALRDQGPIGIGEAFDRQKKLELIPFSPTGVMDAWSVHSSVTRLQKDEYGDDWLSRQKDEENVLQFMRSLEEEQIRGFTWGSNVYRVASQMPAFMVEFMATGGMASLAKKGIQKGAISVAKGVAKAGAGRMARKLARTGFKYGAEVSLRTPMMYNLYWKKYHENQIFANIALTDKGVQILEAPMESKAISFVRAYGDAFIEVGSELLGSKIFKPSGRMIGGKLQPFKKGLAAKLSPEVKAGITKFMKWVSADGKITRAFQKGGFDGIIEEIGEEVVGDQLRAAFGVEDFGEDNIIDSMRAAVPGWDDLSVMAGAFSIPGVTSYSSQRLYNKLIKRGVEKSKAQQIIDLASQTDKERMLTDFMKEENEWLRTAVTKALAGDELTDDERFGLNEKFYEYMDSGDITVTETEAGQIPGREKGEVADIEKAKAIQAVEKKNISSFIAEKHEAFKSNLRYVASTELADEVPADKAMSVLKKQLSKEELDYTGIADFLKTKTMFTRQEIIDYIDAHKVKVEVVFKGGEAEDLEPLRAESEKITTRVEELNKKFGDVTGKDLRDYVYPGIEDTELYAELSDEGQAILNERQEILDKRIEINRRLKEAYQRGQETRHDSANLVLPGGENYMEILVTLPVAEKKESFTVKKLAGNLFGVYDKDGNELATGSTEEIAVTAARNLGRLRTPRDKLGGVPVQLDVNDENSDDLELATNKDSVELSRDGVDYILQYESGEIIYHSTQGEFQAEVGVDHFINPVLTDVEQWLVDNLDTEELQGFQDLAPAQTDDYRSPHWEEKNVLAWIRVNFRTDADGNKVLFIEEMQSDWHKEGRKRGYRKELLKELPDGFRVFKDGDGYRVHSPLPPQGNNALVATGRTEEEATKNALEALGRGFRAEEAAPPDAPFKKSWQELMIKQAIKTAIDNGATKVAWISGEQSSDRYGLEKYLEFLRYYKNEDGSYELEFMEKGSRYSQRKPIKDEKELEDYVGAENVAKMKAGEGAFSDKNEDISVVKRGKAVRIFQKKYTVKEKMFEFKREDGTTGKHKRFMILVDGKLIPGEQHETENQARNRITWIGADHWFVEFADGTISTTPLLDKQAAEDLMRRANYRVKNPVMELSGEGLKVGGAKHKKFYDQMLPDIVNKYIKKWGSKVEMIPIQGIAEYVSAEEARKAYESGLGVVADRRDGSDSEVQSKEELEDEIESGSNLWIDGGEYGPKKQMGFEITPMMKIEVSEIGQPLFGSKLAGGVTGADAIEVPQIVEEILVKAFHGTMTKFKQFSKEKAGIESDFGAGIYFSDSEYDVESNYADEEGGPDMKLRVEALADRYANEMEDDPKYAHLSTAGKYEVAKDRAREEVAPGQARMIEVKLKIKNPVIVGGEKETQFTYEEDYNEETEEYGEPTGTLVDFIEAFKDAASGYGDPGYIQDAVNKLFEAGMDLSVSAQELVKIVKNSEAMYLEDPETGSLAISEIIRQTFEDMGYDSIIDHTVDQKFQNMPNIQGATHYIVFDPNMVEMVDTGLDEPTTKKGRADKYREMAERISEIVKSKEDLKDKKSQAREMLDFFKEERMQWKNKIQRYDDGVMDEEFNELPVYYRAKDGQKLDSAASEAKNDANSSFQGEGDMEFRDFLIQLESDYQRAKDELKDINDQIRMEAEKKEIQSEISSLRQRLSDFKAGIAEATKEAKAMFKTKVAQDKQIAREEKKLLDAAKAEVKRTARSLLPAQGKRYFNKIITAIDSVKKVEDAPAAIAIIVDNYEQYLDRWARAKAVKQILKKYKRPQNVLDVKYREQIKSILSQYGEKRAEQRKALSQMNTDELVDLAREVSLLIEEGKLSLARKNEMKIMASEIMRGAGIVAAGGRVDIEAIGSLEEIRKAGLNPMKQKALKWKYGFARPLRMIRSIFGKYGERMFYDVIEKAETLAQHLKIKRLTRMDEVMKKHNVKTFDLGKTVTIDGHTFQVNNIMTMLAQQNNKEGRAAIIHGNKISEETYEKFISYLKKEYPGAAAAVSEIKVIVGERYEDLRKTMADSFNVSLAKVDDYFPISRARFDRKDEKDPDAIMGMDVVGEAVMKKGHGVNYTAVEKGLSITRKQISDRNQLPISLNFMEDAARAIDSQEHLIHFAGIQKMYNTTKTDKDLRDAVVYNHGMQAWESFDKWMNEAINPRIGYQGLGTFGQMAKQARRSLGVFYLGFNVITAMKQFPSAHLALKYTSFGQLYKSMAKVFDPALQKKIMELDPSIAHRIVEREIGEIMQGASKLNQNDFLRQAQLAEQWLGQKSMKMILNMDRWAVMSVFDAVYESNKKELGHDAAVNLAHKALLETQPQGRRIDLPEEYRSNDQLWRMMLMFTNQLNQIYNMMAFDATTEWKGGQKKEAMITIASIMLSNLMIYGVSHGGWDWPEDEEEQWKAWVEATMGSAISSIPIAGNLAMSAIRGYSPQLLVAGSVIDNYAWNVKKFQNEEYAQATFDIMVDTAVLAGVKIPYGAIKRSIKGIKDVSEGETEDLRRLIWSKSALYE